MTALIAPKYFEKGENVLKTACNEINNWPTIQAGECVQLPLLGSAYQTYLPSLTSANLQHLQQQQHRLLMEQEKKKTNSFPSPSSHTESPLRSVQVAEPDIQETSFSSTSKEEILDNYKRSKQAVASAEELFECDKNNTSDNIFDEIEKSNQRDIFTSGNKDLNNGYEDDEDDDDDVIDTGNCSEFTDTNDNKTNENSDSDGYNDPIKNIENNTWPSPIDLSTKTPIVLSSVNEIDVFRSLSSIISYTHLLWELVLTAEPIVVFANSPTDCSHMVQSLMNLIAPLPFCAEVRPFFTIHDSEFKEFTQRQQGPPSIILGVTNPFFFKTLKHWPHLIRLPENGTATGINICSNTCLNHVKTSYFVSVLNSSLITSKPQRKLKIFSKLSDSGPGVYTQYKPYLQKDKVFLKNLSAGVKKGRPAEVQSALMRRHLLELTQSFMIPLERYIQSLMPLQKDISAFKAAPAPAHFKPGTSTIFKDF